MTTSPRNGRASRTIGAAPAHYFRARMTGGLMTYLGYPRLHFAGAFQADPSTVNNDPAHFDDATFQARFQQPETGSQPDQMNGWWNPRGTGAWRLRDCRVTSVLYSDGSSAASALADPIVGGTLAGADDRVSAKIVDLDPE